MRPSCSVVLLDLALRVAVSLPWPRQSSIYASPSLSPALRILPSAADDAGLLPGLEDQRVVACDASRYFSVAATADGSVWTFGACYNGALGSGSSWSTSAQPVAAELAQTIADGGGAVQVRQRCPLSCRLWQVARAFLHFFLQSTSGGCWGDLLPGADGPGQGRGLGQAPCRRGSEPGRGRDLGRSRWRSSAWWGDSDWSPSLTL